MWVGNAGGFSPRKGLARGIRTEEGTWYFGSCKALTFLSQKRAEPGKPLSFLCFLAVPVQQQGNAGAQTPAVVMQGSASAG